MTGFRTIESQAQQRQLLEFARHTAYRALGENERTPHEKPVIEGRFGGAFVTLPSGCTSDDRFSKCPIEPQASR